MAQQLPLFPLSLVVFPGEKLRLHIFEARYRQMIGECIENGTTFGIVPVIDKEAMEIATEVKIINVDKKYKDGKLDITTRALHRINVRTYQPKAKGKLYPAGEVSPIAEDPTPALHKQEEIFELLKELHHVLGIKKDLPSTASEITAFSIAHHVGFNIRQEYRLLAMDGEEDRLSFICEHLTNFLPVVVQAERMKAKAKLNGHFKIIVPPEDDKF